MPVGLAECRIALGVRRDLVRDVDVVQRRLQQLLARGRVGQHVVIAVSRGESTGILAIERPAGRLIPEMQEVQARLVVECLIDGLSHPKLVRLLARGEVRATPAGIELRLLGIVLGVEIVAAPAADQGQRQVAARASSSESR